MTICGNEWWRPKLFDFRQLPIRLSNPGRPSTSGDHETSLFPVPILSQSKKDPFNRKRLLRILQRKSYALVGKRKTRRIPSCLLGSAGPPDTLHRACFPLEIAARLCSAVIGCSKSLLGRASKPFSARNRSSSMASSYSTALENTVLALFFRTLRSE